MFSRSSLLHLRIPFSYFLLPIYFFALAISPNFNGPRMLWVLIIVHLFLYPASNAYNSYFDKDEKSIGGLKTPPPTTKGLYYLALLFDLIAIVLGFIFINSTFAVMLFVYGAVSKAYSHPSIRLKKHAFTSLVVTGLFQGLFTFIMIYVGINDFALENTLVPRVLVPGVLTSLMLWANYPMTQIYQHEEDLKRGDVTISSMLGVKGTFYFTSAVFGVAITAFLLYFYMTFNSRIVIIFLCAVIPIMAYFFYWMVHVFESKREADYGHTMWLNVISGTCLNAFFIFLFLETTQLLQLNL
jgi:4-hydroxybenzoate polyprenyltransferase